jgi:aryl-phospho-beta-D-glucosidase BglC (GH1 family)
MKLGVALSFLSSSLGQAAVPRNVKINGKQFVISKTDEPIVLGGPNIVVKGHPWLPSVSGNTICKDNTGGDCAKTGSCSSCSTFNQADVDHIKSLGWNFIRLGVMWAGAQPRDEDALDADFLQRLHAVLNLTDSNGIHVMLDNHGDMVGTLGCGNGAPAWFQKKAAPELVGKRPSTAFPYNLVAEINIEKVGGYDHCPKDSPKWAEFAGDPNYNLLNECCQAMNAGGNPGGLGFTEIQQKTMDYSIKPGAGRDEFVRYWRLMAEAVKDHPSAFAFELQNEPMTIRRKWMFDAWKACADSITQVIPDASVSIADTGEGSVLPSWITDLTGGEEDISKETEDWIKTSNTAFYAWHYGDIPTNIKNMQAVTHKWNVPTFGTELGCDHFWAAKDANISHSYWHYSAYCNTGPAFGNRKVPDDTFGACILGWGSGDSSKCATRPTSNDALPVPNLATGILV